VVVVELLLVLVVRVLLGRLVPTTAVLEHAPRRTLNATTAGNPMPGLTIATYPLP